MFFNTKHFNLTSVEEHQELSFSHIMKHWKRGPGQTGKGHVNMTGQRNVLLRYYPPQSSLSKSFTDLESVSLETSPSTLTNLLHFRCQLEEEEGL